MANDVLKTEDTILWENTRTISDGSLTASNEQLALISFAYRLGSTAVNTESSIADENDVLTEARLLMSLSCSSPITVIEESAESGRVTPQSDVSMCSGTSSRRSSFSFACPSLSLENHSQAYDEDAVGLNSTTSQEGSRPSVLLGRVLKVDDMDAMRLSSEAMARNIMQSYQKAIEWRIKTWIESLSAVLVRKEMRIKAETTSEDRLKELLYSSEAKLLVQLRSIREKIHVLDARTSFKVLPQRVAHTNSGESNAKRRRLEDYDDVSGLEETEYQYDVAHTLSLEVFLNIMAPGVGSVQIDLQVPGTIKGTFLSNELESELLTDVMIELNTDILASMIEKSSRMIVRSSVQALLEDNEEQKPGKEVPNEEKQERTGAAATTASADAIPAVPTVTPKRKFSSVSKPVFVTPRDLSSPASFADYDSDDKPLLLSIPDNFSQNDGKRSLRMLTPQASRARVSNGFSLQQRPCSKDREAPQLVTPLNQSKPSITGKGKGPNLPVLVEVACAAMNAN